MFVFLLTFFLPFKAVGNRKPTRVSSVSEGADPIHRSLRRLSGAPHRGRIRWAGPSPAMWSFFGFCAF
jgi:hypothetical protein